MRYAEQQLYLQHSRLVAVASAVGWMAIAFFARAVMGISGKPAFAAGLIVFAIAISLLYTPDYLHLTVNPRKRLRWQIMFRWRIVGAVLILVLAPALNSSFKLKQASTVVLAVMWLSLANVLARRIQKTARAAAYFWVTDFLLLAALLLSRSCEPFLGTMLLAASAHLSVVICESRPPVWACAVILLMCPLLLASIFSFDLSWYWLVAATAMISWSAGATAWLVKRTREQNSRNTQEALRELVDFTGYSPEKIRRLWTESDKELARNWVAAAPDENDSRALAEWYRENSELYMFAISGYNLDYKRIRSNLKMLHLARGTCLDYGAGNGEIILELARRGHAAVYYDVDGISARFARHRANQQGLQVQFVHSKEDLAAVARRDRFDTVFSLDVLEHLPDLQGELAFLSGLLQSRGRLIFDVPAGSTKSHPMHLNHNVAVRSFLEGKGLREQRRSWQELPFVKQEKYLFVAE